MTDGWQRHSRVSSIQVFALFGGILFFSYFLLKTESINHMVSFGSFEARGAGRLWKSGELGEHSVES